MGNNKLNIDEFFNYKFLSDVKINHKEHNLIAFTVKQANVKENNYDSNIFLFDDSKKLLRQMTSSNKDNTIIWAYNGDKIYFKSERDKNNDKKDYEIKTDIYSIVIDGGEAQKAFTIPAVVGKLEFIDSKTVLGLATFDTTRKNTDNMTKEEKMEYFRQLEEEEEYDVADELPFWSNGEGFINLKRIRIFTFDIDTGDFNWITSEEMIIKNYHYDNNRIAIVGQNREDKMEVKNDLYLYKFSEKNLIKISENSRFFEKPILFDDKIIILAKDGNNFGNNENPKFYSYSLLSKEVKCLTPDYDFSNWNSVNSDCRLGSSSEAIKRNNKKYFVTTAQDSSFVFKIDSEGKIKQLITKEGAVDAFDVRGDKIVFVGLREQKLQELYSVILNTVIEHQLTNLNSEILLDKYIAKPEYFSVPTDEGLELDSWILTPKDFDSTKKYPAIMQIHGGPKTAFGTVFIHEMQLLANEGYIVFFTNPRGSDGRGNKFMDIRGKYGTIDYDDLMKVVDYAIEHFPYIDKDRLGVTGGSYGGFMTNWIIGQTDRFKAAVSLRSIANLSSFFNESDIGYYFGEDQWASTPWQDIEKLWNQSPVKYADQAKTPTLFIHSTEDWRCPPSEGYQMFTALKYHRIPARLVMFKGENHELSRSGMPKHRLRRLSEIVAWFDKYLKE